MLEVLNTLAPFAPAINAIVSDHAIQPDERRHLSRPIASCFGLSCGCVPEWLLRLVWLGLEEFAGWLEWRSADGWGFLVQTLVSSPFTLL